MHLTERWQRIFASVALSIASASKDPSTRVGAVIYRPPTADCAPSIASMGFNGFPPEEPDDERLTDRTEKLKHMIHAERNAIRFSREDITGYGIVCTLMPCSDCAKRIINEGLKTVYHIKAPDVLRERWADSFAMSEALFRAAGVEVIEIDYQELCQYS